MGTPAGGERGGEQSRVHSRKTAGLNIHVDAREGVLLRRRVWSQLDQVCYEVLDLTLVVFLCSCASESFLMCLI